MGITFLLEVAGGDRDALETAQVLTSRSPDALKHAAEFFIEQVLLARSADSYRILGATRGASTSDLRRHMALLMKWAHPDVAGNGKLDRSVFANRIIKAWEDLKTEERRATYDSSKRERSFVPRQQARFVNGRPKSKTPATGATKKPTQRAKVRKLAMFKLSGDGFLKRVLTYFRGR
ncbi:MAG: J domain-containing protein [Hyphomicrobiaceae bacterium]